MPVACDIPKAKSAQAGNRKNLDTSVLQWDTEEQSSGSERDKAEAEGDHSHKDHGFSEDEKEETDLVQNPSLHGMGFEAMLRSVLFSKSLVN